jgi:hypothetical protein
MQKFYVIANGRIIKETNTFDAAVKHVHGMAWSFDVFDKIEIVGVVVADAKKI